MKCPKCGYSFGGLIYLQWGNAAEAEKTRAAPLICKGCAALLILVFATNEILDPPDACWDIVREKNPGLWLEIEGARRAMLAADGGEVLPELARQKERTNGAG